MRGVCNERMARINTVTVEPHCTKQSLCYSYKQYIIELQQSKGLRLRRVLVTVSIFDRARLLLGILHYQ